MGHPTRPGMIRICSGINREVEHAAMVAAAGVGVGPEVTALIRPEGYLLTRLIAGSLVTLAAVGRPDRWRAWRTRYAGSTTDRPPGTVRAPAGIGLMRHWAPARPAACRSR